MHMQTVIAKPWLLLPHKRIYLLSHMRANTSVLGHVLGSNPEIAGYYEMHIGYYSWKSFFRQKLLYYQLHDYKPGTKYLFDKVLHDYHYVSPALLNRKTVTTLMSLREPEQTIPSIVSLFRTNFTSHEYHSVDEAFKYYCERVTHLMKLAESLDSYYYYDASLLRSDTDRALQTLTAWLNLSTPLKKDYNSFALTGKKDSGDKTEHLKSGKLQNVTSDYSNISLRPEQIEQARAIYTQAHEVLVKHSTESMY